MLFTILILLCAAIHGYFVWLEMFRWEAARTRKLFGTVLVLGSILVWSVAGMWIYMSFLGAAVWWALIGFFALVGMSWFFPATWIIRWMSRPDA